MPARKNLEVFIIPCFPAPSPELPSVLFAVLCLLLRCERASWQHRNAEIKGINRNRYGIARTVAESARGEVRGSLVGYALRKISAVRRVVGAKNSAKLVPDGKQVVVISQIGQELAHGFIRWGTRENGVLNRRESVARLHYMCNPTAAGELLIQEAGSAVVGHCQRDVGGIADGGMRQVRFGPGDAAVGGAADMERVDVSFARAIRPTDVDGGTVTRIDGDGQCRTDSFLAESGGIGPGDSDLLDDQAAGQFV